MTRRLLKIYVAIFLSSVSKFSVCSFSRERCARLNVWSCARTTAVACVQCGCGVLYLTVVHVSSVPIVYVGPSMHTHVPDNDVQTQQKSHV